MGIGSDLIIPHYSSVVKASLAINFSQGDQAFFRIDRIRACGDNIWDEQSRYQCLVILRPLQIPLAVPATRYPTEQKSKQYA
jgi:hypothetical protein